MWGSFVLAAIFKSVIAASIQLGSVTAGMHSEIILTFQDMTEKRDALARELKKDQDEKIK